MEICDKIYIKTRHTFTAIRLDNITYMEKRERQITVHVAEGDDVCFYGKYDSVMPQLDERFTHPHESYIINMDQIFRLGCNEAVLYGGETLVFGNRCFGRLKQAYEGYIRNHISKRLGI